MNKKRFQGQLKWLDKRRCWRLDWRGKYRGSFKNKEDAERLLEQIKIEHAESVRLAEIDKYGNASLKVCTRCKVKMPETHFGSKLVKSTGELKPFAVCPDCREKQTKYKNTPEQLEKRAEYKALPSTKDLTKKQNQKPEGKLQRAALQKLPESKKRKKLNPPPSASPSKRREVMLRHSKTPKYRARIESIPFRLRQSLQAKLRNALKGRKYVPDLVKLAKICPWGVSKNAEGHLDATDLQRHFATLLKPGMSLDNYGSVWSIGHQIPAVYYDLADPEDAKRCNSQANLVCDYAIRQDGELTNSEKGSKLPTDDVMVMQGSESWPVAWKGVLPAGSMRSKLEHDAWSGMLSVRKAGGQRDIRKFIKGSN